MLYRLCRVEVAGFQLAGDEKPHSAKSGITLQNYKNFLHVPAVLFIKNAGADVMDVHGTLRGGILRLSLSGELDECSAAVARRQCDELIDANVQAERIVINLAGVRFMDSTGIGFLIGRYKKAARLNIPVSIENPDFAADKILNLSGIYTLIPKT